MTRFLVLFFLMLPSLGFSATLRQGVFVQPGGVLGLYVNDTQYVSGELKQLSMVVCFHFSADPNRCEYYSNPTPHTYSCQGSFCSNATGTITIIDSMSLQRDTSSDRFIGNFGFSPEVVPAVED